MADKTPDKKENTMKSVKNQKKSSIFTHWYLISPILLCIITALVYYPSLHYSFQFDDIANIQKHFKIRHYNIHDLFFISSRWISYWLNAIHFSIGRFDPFSYRVGNVIIHTLNGFLIFLVIYFCLSRLKKETFFARHNFSIALITSTFFLLHPVQTQTVSYVIQGELEGLAALFSLATLFSFLCATSKTISLNAQILAIISMFTFAFFSCGTKEITIVLPLLIMLIDWFFIAQGSWQSFQNRLWMHISLSTMMIGMYIFLLKPRFFADLFGFKMAVKNNIGNVITQNPLEKITPYTFCISQFKVILHYLWIFVWPFNICVEYDWVISKSFFALDCLVPFLILLSLAAITYYLLKKNVINPIAFCMLWFALCMAPRASIIPSPELMVDYKTYLASISIFILFAAAIVKIVELVSHTLADKGKLLVDPRAQSILALLIAAPLSVMTIQRNTVWSSGTEFWANVIKNAPGKARAYNNYGVELSQGHGKFAEAIPYFQKAIAMDKLYPDPCNNLAVAYAKTGNYDAAIETIQQSMKINPYYPEGYNNMASFYIYKKDYQGAIRSLEKALMLRSYYGKALYNMGRVYMEMGEQEKAWIYFKKCCTEGDLDTKEGFSVYAQVSLNLRKLDDAITGYKKVLEFDPHDENARFCLGNAYFFKDDFEQARRLYAECLNHNQNDMRALYNMAEVYIRLNEPAKAIEYFERIPGLIEQAPHMGLRLTECYEKIGNTQKATQLLAQMNTKHDQLPAHVKQQAKQKLARLQDGRKRVVA
jgi:protein O-mannosyl-transferase